MTDAAPAIDVGAQPTADGRPVGRPVAAAESVPSKPDPTDGGTQLDRVIFFSDAVFAIAITLLVIDVHLPDPIGQARPLDVLNALAPQIFAFVLSFVVIGRYWITHHGMFGLIRDFDSRLIALNLLLLLFIAFIPFPTQFLGEYGSDPSGPVVYALNNAGASGSLALLYWYANRAGLMVPGLDPRYVRYVTLRLLRTFAVFLLSIPIAVYLSPTLAEFSWVLILPFGFLLHRANREAADLRPGRASLG